ncbi:hypothetical protein RhiirC2_774306 [Rhizophagus irregularis]|uniref:Uncharacterized protein n=1 Tax=Rhizophagus irregularis TaxID=588596 RepID=A0A2N1NLX9_9GLOM|nr:hypothetical protein RhiirC2_774306 [Rhizophagus irregularis]
MRKWARKRLPCSEPGCNKPTGSASGRCRQHIRGYYQIQYVNRLRDNALMYDQYLARVQELANLNAQRRQENLIQPLSYEQLMNSHRDRLEELNITLCRECLIPIGSEGGEYCNECIA